jgi:hypothetical protein
LALRARQLPNRPQENSDTFVAFIEQLLEEYPNQHLILVMDNASYHHSATVQSALSLYQDRILVIWLPKYSPFSTLSNASGCISNSLLLPIGCTARLMPFNFLSMRYYTLIASCHSH